MKAVIYKSTTGEIVRTYSGPEEFAALQCGDDEAWVAGECDDTVHYVDTVAGSIQPRADYALDSLPIPCVVTIEGINYNCSSQPVFEFDAPGDYEIVVDAGQQYLKKVFNVNQS